MLETYSATERTEILRRYRNLIEVWHTRKGTSDRWMVRKAFRLAADAHKDMRRKTGEPYIYHPLDVATIAAGEIGLGRTSIICALLHDVVEDTEYKLSDIQGMFGEQVSRIIDGLTKIDDMVEGTDVESMQAENFRKVLLTLSYDVRVILIKLADRLHNMRTLDAMPAVKQWKIASETSYLFAPLAYRLGLYAIKSELEDLALKYTEPGVYQAIHRKLEQGREKRNKNVEEFLEPVNKALGKMGLKFRTLIAEKSASSIWQRMKEKEIPFEEVYDTYVVRFVVDCPVELEKVECWRVYATITGFYRPNNDRLRDWISLPKANGYESLHATVMSKTGKWIEVQIRTERMDEIAEKGYAAYWKYKGSEVSESGLDEWLTKVRELITTEDASALDFINNFKLNLFSDEIFVFTPKGEMISMPTGSTALDFAYNIHTELGNHCIGANVNHKLVQLDHPLKTGDQVEIITSRVQLPKEEWFDFVVTARAKSRLKEGIREYRKGFRDQGREKLDNYFKQLKLEPIKANISRIIEHEELSGLVDLYYYIATDKINFQRIKAVFKEKATGGIMRYLANPFSWSKATSAETDDSKSAVKVMPPLIKDQTSEFSYTVSRCCNPIPGDEVVALVFPNEPMHIHRINCPKAKNLMSQFGNNIVKAKWKQKEDIAFLAGLRIIGIDSVGFIQRFTEVVSTQLNLNIRSLQLESSKGVVEATVTIYVHNAQNLKDLIEKLKKVKEIKKVTRLDRIDDLKA
ncbi:MAG: RelA/SpoT family protein [Bacteroidetes bacterium]|jgi:guanosine-3',5'-bis(diphosphate) 3'-pyrophosphohydrolase|nr:RelA/SpoT family protein [Bacteroidota bacterium]